MRKVIRASRNATEEVQRILGVFEDEKVPVEEIFDYFLARLTSEEALRILKDYADICGIDLYE